MASEKILKFQGAALRYRGRAVTGDFEEPEPVLPVGTIRCKFSSGYTPTMGDSQTLVDATENIWDIYKAGDRWNRLFERCTELLEVLASNLTGVTSAYAMFSKCASLAAASLTGTGGINDVGYMFEDCTSLAVAPMFDMGGVETARYMFEDCTALTTVPEYNTGNVEGMEFMFKGCTSLASVPLFDTGNAVRMSSMFQGCTSLVSVPLFDTGSVTSAFNMFYGCTGLTAVPLFDTGSMRDMYGMFYGCTHVESGALALYQQASQQESPPTSYTYCFYRCGMLAPADAPIHAEMQQIPSSWGGYGS